MVSNVAYLSFRYYHNLICGCIIDPAGDH